MQKLFSWRTLQKLRSISFLNRQEPPATSPLLKQFHFPQANLHSTFFQGKNEHSFKPDKMIAIFSGDNLRYIIELRDGFLPRVFFNKGLILVNEFIKLISRFSPKELVLAYVGFVNSLFR